MEVLLLPPFFAAALAGEAAHSLGAQLFTCVFSDSPPGSTSAPLLPPGPAISCRARSDGSINSSCSFAKQKPKEVEVIKEVEVEKEVEKIVEVEAKIDLSTPAAVAELEAKLAKKLAKDDG